jgi:hypothetical protein
MSCPPGGTQPWLNAPVPPWLTAQPLYDRVISIRRPFKATAVGALPYSGLSQKQETVIFTAIAASIQFQPKRDRPLGGTPSDADSVAQWHVFIANGIIAAGQIIDRDVIADDLGRRFQVSAAWPTVLGWVLATVLLEA